MTIVDDLKNENILYADGINSKLQGNEVIFNTALQDLHGSAGFFDTLSARSVIAAATPFPGTTATSKAQKLNMALDALVKANSALATADQGGIPTEVRDLVARVADAQSISAALKK